MRSVSDYLPDVSIADVIPDSVLDAVRSLVRAIPGYTALTYVVGKDLLTGEPVHIDIDAMLDAVLTYGPFGPAVSTVLRGLSIAQEIFQAVSAQFAAHNLTPVRWLRSLGALSDRTICVHCCWIDDEEVRIGIGCVAAPVLHGEVAVAAVSVAGAAAEIRQGGYARLVREAAARIGGYSFGYPA